MKLIDNKFIAGVIVISSPFGLYKVYHVVRAIDEAYYRGDEPFLEGPVAIAHNVLLIAIYGLLLVSAVIVLFRRASNDRHSD